MHFSMDGVIVRHREVFGRVRGIDRPKINDLTAMGIGYTDGLVFSNEESGSAASGEGLCGHVFETRGVKGENAKIKLERKTLKLIYPS